MLMTADLPGGCPDMLKYIDAVEIRPGFGEFLDRMAELRIPDTGGSHIGWLPSGLVQRKLEP